MHELSLTPFSSKSQVQFLTTILQEKQKAYEKFHIICREQHYAFKS